MLELYEDSLRFQDQERIPRHAGFANGQEPSDEQTRLWDFPIFRPQKLPPLLRRGYRRGCQFNLPLAPSLNNEGGKI